MKADLCLGVQSAGATDNTCKGRIYTTRACLTSNARRKLVGSFKTSQGRGHGKFRSWDGTWAARRGDHCLPPSLSARHAWQRRDGIRRAESTKRNMTVLGGRVASTCMLYFAKARSIRNAFSTMISAGLAHVSRGPRSQIDLRELQNAHWRGRALINLAPAKPSYE